ncbi:uncharacterized protein LOC121422508 [Lytechinus variegatus]|uniref:uncharacterized protein LOC121422508 n=1 Tax=Lytechinus variegatus TaxID=7654 RepID=UPI001BB1C707|nr:uncharacterized protein LOC121422508 [Lytechinus variegatus]
MAMGCAAGSHVSKSQLIVCIIGFLGFTLLALGAVSDYWVTYGINTAVSSGGSNGTSPLPTTLLQREGLWRICLQYIANESTDVTGHMCFFGLSAPDSVSMPQGLNSQTRYEVSFLIATWVLYGVGVVLSLIAVVMAIAALRHKKNQTLLRGVSALFILAALLAFVGLVIYAVRTSRFPDQWPEGDSPYSSASLGWAYSISWVGLLLSVIAGAGHLWVLRRYEDSMI